MAKGGSNNLFLLLLSILTISSSAIVVGFSLNARGNSVSSSPATCIRVYVADHRVLSTLSNSGASFDLYLNESLVEKLLHSEASAVSWLKNHVVTSLPHVNIKSIVLGGSSSSSEKFARKNVLVMFLSTLKLLLSALSRVHLDREIKVSVAFSLSSLENLKATHERDLQRIFSFIKKTRSFVIVEASSVGELSMGGYLSLQSVIKEANLAISSLPISDISIILTIKSPVVVNAKDVAEFITKVSESLESSIEIRGTMDELYTEVSSVEDFAQKELKREQKEIFPSFRKELVNSLKTTLHDSSNPPTTVLPTAPVTIPPDIPTPTIVTVLAANPVTITPTNPDSSPLPIPSITPVNIPPATTINPPAEPVTSPATTPSPITVPGAQPIINPVRTYPAPAGNVPVTTPVTNPVSPPAQTNAPAIPGQSWCVARTGASETALQSGLDYACGNGADCSQIQQGGSCYNPDTVQNHASFAFNTYYQKNPTPTSCDFGGTAVIVNTNPSTGSCVYPSSASSSSSTPATPTTPTPTPTPVSTAPPATTTTTPVPEVPGSVSPPTTVLNSSSGTPTSVFGSDSPPVVNTSTSTSACLQPFIHYFIFVPSFVAGIIILHV